VYASFINYVLSVTRYKCGLHLYYQHLVKNVSGTITVVQFRLYSVSALLPECHEWSAAPTSAYLRRDAFAVNAVLVVSEKQHHA